MSPWFAAAAAGETFQTSLGLDAAQAGWLVTIVPLGFVVGTAVAALLNLADVLPSRVFVAGSALAAALCNLALLGAGSFSGALASRFATGFFLAGVYPPAMKMAATWFRGSRGLAIGAIVGALTIGKAFPYLVASVRAEGSVVIGAASLASALAAIGIVCLYRDGPYASAHQPFDWNRVGEVLRDRSTRLATTGYMGHMWELYAMWSAIGAFFADSLLVHGAAAPGSTAKALAFWTISTGAVGAVVAGWAADRIGRERVAAGAMAVSAGCALSVGWLVAAPLMVLVPLVLVWGFFVVADSAQFSALATETAPAHLVGTALTLQVSLGFLVSMVTVQALPQWAAAWGWGPAFSLLAVGPLVGIHAMRRLAGARASSTSR